MGLKEIESDLCFVSACILIGAGVEAMEEKVGILEHDAGLSRDEANHVVLEREMKQRDGRYSRRFINEFFDLAGPALLAEIENGWARQKTWELLRRGLARRINARV